MTVAESGQRRRDTPGRHADQIFELARGRMPATDIEEVTPSWLRSARQYRVDPAAGHAPSVLTSPEIRDRRERMSTLVRGAQEEMDSLYRLVRAAGYVVLLCDLEGVAIDHRGEDGLSSLFRLWGTWLGGVWSETVEGTNGIGTCIVERRPITVHRAQHFRSRNKDLSCSGAPIFDADGTMLAVLDVSAIDPGLSEPAHALTGILTQTSAHAIEERLFRERFRDQWIIAVAPPETDAPAMFLAVDDHQQVIGADAAARANLPLDDTVWRQGIGLWHIFERDLALFRHKDTCDLPVRLVRAGGNEAWPGLLTPPERPSRASTNTASTGLHVRPRRDLLRALRQVAAPPQARGGLPGNAMRRVSEYVEQHLGESIDLATLAAIAGVSVFHFARQFKQTTGEAPHAFLIRRRVERARDMLTGTDLPLSEIALINGFADQGHFGRHFRRLTGTTPRAFRRSSR